MEKTQCLQQDYNNYIKKTSEQKIFISKNMCIKLTKALGWVGGVGYIGYSMSWAPVEILVAENTFRNE